MSGEAGFAIAATPGSISFTPMGQCLPGTGKTFLAIIDPTHPQLHIKVVLGFVNRQGGEPMRQDEAKIKITGYLFEKGIFLRKPAYTGG